MKTLLLLALLAQSVSAQPAWLWHGEAIYRDLQPGTRQLEREARFILSGDRLVRQEIVPRFYVEGGTNHEITTLTWFCHRTAQKVNEFKPISVREQRFDPAKSAGRLSHWWPPERVAELPNQQPACNIEGRHEARWPDRIRRQSGYHTWRVLGPEGSGLIFKCLVRPDKGTKGHMLDWKITLSGGEDETFSPTAAGIPTASYAPFTPEFIAVGAPNQP